MENEIKHTPGFSITNGKGFHIRFDNGWTVSVQFGWGNHGDNYDNDELMELYKKITPRHVCSTRAEIAAWDENDNWYDFGGSNTVDGYKTVEEVFCFMQEIKAKAKGQ